MFADHDDPTHQYYSQVSNAAIERFSKIKIFKYGSFEHVLLRAVVEGSFYHCGRRRRRHRRRRRRRCLFMVVPTVFEPASFIVILSAPQVSWPFYNIYLGITMVFSAADPPNVYGRGKVHCQLVWSPDGNRYLKQ